MFTKLQTSVNMNLSLLSENLQCEEMVIQFCQEKNLIGKIKLPAMWASLPPKENVEKLCLEMP